MKRVNFAGNDYLGLARDPRLAEAMCRAAKEYGVGATSGRTFLGWTDVHQQLEDDLAEFMGTEDACVIPAAYLGGLFYYKRMAEHCKTVFCDRISHANQFDGMHAAGFEIRPFEHLDAGDLRRQLAAYDGPPPLVATDSVYGMSGELAPLREIADAAREAGAELVIDDAHGGFALGESGMARAARRRRRPSPRPAPRRCGSCGRSRSAARGWKPTPGECATCSPSTASRWSRTGRRSWG